MLSCGNRFIDLLIGLSNVLRNCSKSSVAFVNITSVDNFFRIWVLACLQELYAQLQRASPSLAGISILACVRVSPSGHNHQRSLFCVHQLIPLQTYHHLRSSIMHSGLSDSSIFWISRSSWNFWIWILDLSTHQS